MPVGTHPNNNVQGQLIGILVAMQPAQGELTMVITVNEPQDVEEQVDGQTVINTVMVPVEREVPNPEYISAEQATRIALETAIAGQGIEVNPDGGECREVWFSGATPEELAVGQIRAVATIRVGDAGEVVRRTAIDTAFAQFTT